MRYFIILPILLFFGQFLLAQDGVIHLTNPSFEGTPGEGGSGPNLPEGWHDCGFKGETPPDVHPKPGVGAFQVTTRAFHGQTYFGLVVRENDTWEMVGQALSKPLKAGQVYGFGISLCRSEIFLSASRVSNKEANYAAPATLRIWGGDSYCERKELLAETGPVVNTDWKDYEFEISPSENFDYIVLEAFYKTPNPIPYNGNLLMDYASDFVPIENENVDVVNEHRSKLWEEQAAIYLQEKEQYKGTNEFKKASKEKLLRDPSNTPAPRRSPTPPIVDTSYYKDLNRYEFTRPLMGTEFRIVIYHTDALVAKQAAEKAFLRVAVLEKVFSDYMETSEVSMLCDAGKSDVSDELWTVLDYAQEVSQRSEGAFDVSVGALTKLWRKAFREKEFPSEAEIEKAAATVGYQDISMKAKNQTVKLDKAGMRLDFGGIAKGYAVDEARAWLKVSGIDMFLVDGGGDLLVGMPPPGKPGWEIEVPDKFVNGELTYKKAFYKNTAVATSGDAYRYLEHDGKRYSHIIDPRTGYGLTNRRTVTVTAPTCMAADAWATAASVGIKKLLTVDLKEEGVRIQILEE